MNPGIVLTGLAIVAFMAVLFICVVLEEWTKK